MNGNRICMYIHVAQILNIKFPLSGDPAGAPCQGRRGRVYPSPRPQTAPGSRGEPRQRRGHPRQTGQRGKEVGPPTNTRHG